jgi:hypothetical protein
MKHFESFCSQTCIILTRQILLIFLESPKHIFFLFQIHITDSSNITYILSTVFLLESWTLIYFSCFSNNFWTSSMLFSSYFYSITLEVFTESLFYSRILTILNCFVLLYVRKSESSSSFIRFFTPSSTIATRFVYNDDHSQNFELEFEFVLMSNKGVNSSSEQ